MKYLNILIACACQPWALHREKLETVSRFLIFKAHGGMFTAEEVQARITQKQERQIARDETGNIAVIGVSGVLMQRVGMLDDISGGTSMEDIAAQFRAKLADPATKAIVLDFDSPGGTVFGTEELAREIFDSRGTKPVIAQVNSMAASGAYWLAAQADEIVVTPGGSAGSIGVYTIHEDISKALEMEGVKETIIRSGKFKLEAAESQPLTEDARAELQRRVDESARAFNKAVARGRNVSNATVSDRFGQGRMFGAAELVDRGMADRIATLPETLERFGASVHPVASAARAGRVAHAKAAETLAAKLKAGDQPTPREWEHGLKGTFGLSNSEAERAVRLCFKGHAQGDPGKPTEPAVAEADIAEMKGQLADIRKLLRA